MKKYKYLLCILSFLTLLGLIQLNNYEKLNEFNHNFVLETMKEETGKIEENSNTYQEEITSLQQEYNNQDVVGTLEILNTDYKVPMHN